MQRWVPFSHSLVCACMRANQDHTPALSSEACGVARIADCKGGSLVLNGDLSLQLVLSAELQALVRDAGLPVQLLLDIERPLPDVSVKHWALFNVPVRRNTPPWC